jgi:UV DNA damage repair endonuclease
MIKRIGFACKWSEYDSKNRIVAVENLNFKTTTIAWLNRQTRDVAEQRLYDIMIHNIAALEKLVNYVGNLPESLRMVRIGSDILPVYTHDSYSYYWRQADVQRYCETNLHRIGDTARALNVRLSFHPGQFTVLASNNPGIVEKSIEEFEYHADMARYMGYGKSFQDFKINVHISGRRGPQGIIDVLPRLSPEARNCITIENDENSWGVESSLELVKHCALVLDIHHHWVATGEYIQPTDDRVLRIIDSWRGVRPVIHYSVSREDILVDHAVHHKPDYADLLESGHKKAKLRSHSDFYWNTATNEWALSFLENSDIMCESKSKNLASFKLYDQAKQLGVL